MIKKIYKKYEIIFNVVLFSIFPIAAFYLMEFYEHNPFEEVRFMAGFFNIILFELIAWILYFVTGRAKWALRAVFIVAMVLYTADTEYFPPEEMPSYCLSETQTQYRPYCHRIQTYSDTLL
jgi:ABC-type multidrug transport system permease subunit